MPAQNKVSLPVIKRLPKYYRYLVSLSADGRDKVSSSELARMMGTTASQVRQDFNCFGGFGQQGIGYKVDVLLEEIGRLLFGSGELLPTILIGAGRLGNAVSSFIARDTNGYRLIAAFDINPDLVGREMSGVTIRPLEELESFCREYKPVVAVLCVPRQSAVEVSGALLPPRAHSSQGPSPSVAPGRLPKEETGGNGAISSGAHAAQPFMGV